MHCFTSCWRLVDGREDSQDFTSRVSSIKPLKIILYSAMASKIKYIIPKKNHFSTLKMVFIQKKIIVSLEEPNPFNKNKILSPALENNHTLKCCMSRLLVKYLVNIWVNGYSPIQFSIKQPHIPHCAGVARGVALTRCSRGCSINSLVIN